MSEPEEKITALNLPEMDPMPEHVKKYFKLLGNKNYSEAYSFLKGGETKHNDYYKKRRLNNFFKNNKSIIGHLEIFISLYEILHMVRMKLLNY